MFDVHSIEMIPNEKVIFNESWRPMYTLLYTEFTVNIRTEYEDRYVCTMLNMRIWAVGMPIANTVCSISVCLYNILSNIHFTRMK